MKLLLLLILPFLLYSASLKELHNLTPTQLQVLHKTVAYGKAHNLSLTLAATAWKESNFGKYLVGQTTPDYGVFQINYHTYKNRYADRIKQSGLTKPEVIKMLTHSFDVNIEAAVAEYSFWSKTRNWRHSVESYNDGTHISHKGRSYRADIVKRVNLLKQFLRRAT